MTPMRPEPPHAGARPILLVGADPQRVAPLPAAIDETRGVVLTEWAFSAEDLAAILHGGRLRLWTYTGGDPFHPVYLEVVEWSPTTPPPTPTLTTHAYELRIVTNLIDRCPLCGTKLQPLVPHECRRPEGR